MLRSGARWQSPAQPEIAWEGTCVCPVLPREKRSKDRELNPRHKAPVAGGLQPSPELPSNPAPWEWENPSRDVLDSQRITA